MVTLTSDSLGKAYRIYRNPFDSLKEVFLRKQYSETFWALRDVTLQLSRGECFGIVGDNGAGKSTLLKLLAGAITPTTGSIERLGRVSALLSLGGGFHPDLSGIENIRIGCATLGLSPAGTDKLLPEIVEFSELGDFVNRPVRTYSTGMHLRLGFSVATAIEPEILVVDEHLSVGDQHFQHKCLRRIMALRSGGCTLVFCSHNMHAIADVCDRCLWLRDGQPEMIGPVHPVLDAYQDHVRSRDSASKADIHKESTVQKKRQSSTDNCLREVVLGGDCQDGEIETGGTLKLRIVARLSDVASSEGVRAGLAIMRNDAVRCYGVTTKMDQVTLYPMGGDEHGVTFVIDHLLLLSGEYSFTVVILDDASPYPYDFWQNVAPFRVRNSGEDVGVTRILHRWERP